MYIIFMILSLFFSSNIVASTPGTLDTSFGSTGIVTTDIGVSTVDNAYGSAVQPDGKIVVVGSAGSSMAMVRYTITGTPDAQFGTAGIVTQGIGTNAVAYGVAIQNDGKIVVVGTSDSSFFIARFLPDGLLDSYANDTISPFGNATPASATGYVIQSIGTTAAVYAVAIQPSNQKIIVAGTSLVSTNNCVLVAQFTTQGVLDTGNFNTGGTPGYNVVLHPSGSTNIAYACAFDSSYNIVISGSSGTALLVARYLSTGVLDTTGFNALGTPGYNTQGSSNTIGYSIGFQTVGANAGKIVIAGQDQPNALLIRYTTTGLLDSYANETTSPFGIGGAGSQTGYITGTLGGTAATLHGVAIQSNDAIVVGGTVTNSTTNFVIASYVANGSGLDTSFGTTSGYTATDISGAGSIDSCSALSIQANGRFVLAGTTDSSAGNFATVRYLGAAGVQGDMDVTYQSGTTPGFKTYPTDSTPTDHPQVVAIYPMTGAQAGDVYVVTSESNSSTNTQLVQLNSSGAVSATAVVIAQPTPTDVISDSQNRAVTIGNTITPHGYIARYNVTGGAMAIDSTFASGTILTETTNSTSFLRVAEQKAGLLIVIGQAATVANGLLIAYTESGTLANSTTSVPFGTNPGSGVQGFITMSSATFYDLLIDSSDGIYVAFSNGTNLCIAKYLANGSALATFGTAGIINTGLAIATYTGHPSITFDATGNYIIFAVTDSSGNIAIKKYLISDSSVTSGSIAQTTSLFSTPVLTKLQCDTDNRLIFGGYDSNDFFVARSGAGVLTLDTTFAPYSSSPGIMKSMYNTDNPTDGTTPARVSNSICISTTGNILFGGYENINSSMTVSLVGQVVGYSSGTIYTQVNRFPGATVAGILNVDFGNEGALDLTVAPASLSNGQARAMYTLSSGNILVADSNGTSTNLTQLTAAYALDTGSFGSGTGKISLSTMAQATTMMVDAAGNSYVLGTTAGGAVVVYKVNSAGTTATVINIPAAAATAGLTDAYDIVQQASGRILIAGYNSSHTGGASGVIMAYDPVLNLVDTSFNSTGTYPGYWFTGIAHPTTSIAVGIVSAYADKIYFAYENGSSQAVVARLLENGTALDSSFTFGTGIPSVSDQLQIKMQLDVNGKIDLVAQTGATAGVQAARYTANGANDVVAFTVFTNGLGALVRKVLALSDGTTLILASTGVQLYLADLTTAFALNTNFNPLGATPGILSTTVPAASSSMVDFYTMDTMLAGGFLVGGDNSATASTAHPYFAGVENTTAPTKVSQSATSTGLAGLLDTTFNETGSTAGFMNLAAELQTTQFPSATTVKALLEQSNGTYFIGGSTTTDSFVTLMSDDDVQQTGFGSSGLLTISGKANLAAMKLAQSGALLVTGGNGSSGSHAGWLRSYSATTGAVTAGFTPPTGAGNVLDTNFGLAQQSNGRILVAGIQAGVGSIIAYNSVTGAVDTTFGVNGIYTATGYTGINSILVDTLDNIYCIANSSGNDSKVICLQSNGTVVNWTTALTTNSSYAPNNHLAFNSHTGSSYIVAVSCNTTDNTIKVNTFSPGASGGTAGTALTLNSTQTGITTPNITSIVVDLNTSPGKVIITGYDSNATPNIPFVMRILADISGLDTTFNYGATYQGVQSYHTLSSGVTSNWYASMINADGKITVGGYASVLTTPYLMRLYGDEFIGQYSPSLTPSPAAGTPGTIDTNFGTSGELLLAGISGAIALAGASPEVVVPVSNGQYYIGLNNPGSVISQVIRLTNGLSLDGTFGSTGFATNIEPGINDLIIDGASQLVAVGTSSIGFDHGWAARYVAGNTGTLDTSFGGAGIIDFDPIVLVYGVAQQTLGRYILCGTLTGLSGNGGLVALTNTGAIDTTFNSNGTLSVGGTTPGYYDIGIASGVYALAIDQYDRIIIAYLTGSAAINVVRLTSAGQLDTSFNNTGIVTSMVDANSVDQVRVAVDQAGNIIVAAHTTSGISVRGLTTSGNNLYSQLNITTIITNTPVLTDLIATTDGNVLLSGSQSGANPMWVARITVGGILDTTFGGGDGIMTFSFDGSATARLLYNIAIYGDGQIAMVGTETDGTVNPFLSMAYDTPYTAQVSQSPDAKASGTNDITLGASSTSATNKGITFYGSSGADATSGQVARAVALQNDANIVVAIDGAATSGGTNSSIFIDMFNIDGVLNTTFNTTGLATVLSSYQNQYVRDMVTFTTTAGVYKAILAGYVTNSTLGRTDSLLLQYNLSSAVLDSSFGGYDGNPAGIAFGDGQQLWVVGQQTTGRIVACGLDQNGAGLLLGYTSAGKLDFSFGNDGYQSVNTGSTGIYTHAIDTLNRIVFAYNNAGNVVVSRMLPDGSGLDTTFGTSGTVAIGNQITGVTSNSNMKVVVDGTGCVIVAAVTNSGANISLNRYNTAGTAVLQTQSYGGASLGGSSSSVYTLGRLLVDAQDNVVITAYDTNPTPDTILVTRWTISGGAYIKDTTFNTTGYLVYQVAAGNTQTVTDALILPDGRIIVVGSEN